MVINVNSSLGPSLTAIIVYGDWQANLELGLTHVDNVHGDATVRGHGIAAGNMHGGATARGHGVAIENGMLWLRLLCRHPFLDRNA